LVRPFTPAQQAFVPAKVALLPIYGSLNGHGSDAIIDTVRASKADVIVDIGDIDSRYIAIADQVQAAAGIPYVLIDGALAKSADAYRLLGQLIGEPKRAEILASESDAILTSVQQRLADLSAEQRPRIYYGRGPTGLQTGGARSLNLETIKTGGGINVGDSLDKGGLASVSADEVIAWNPDVILMQERPAYDAFIRGEEWKTVKAVHDGRVFLVPGAPFGWVEEPPSVNRLIGVRWIAALLYPDRFPEDIAGIVRDFYRTFYQVEPTNTQINTLLTDAFRK
jgi:iron complex transport system substrate-binding protein